MANIVIIEDAQGDALDQHVYCSDDCAGTDPAYAGWYGCVELERDEWCAACGARVSVDPGGECDWRCAPSATGSYAASWPVLSCAHGVPEFVPVTESVKG